MNFSQKNVLKHLQVADIPELTVSSTVQEGCKLLQGMGVKFLPHFMICSPCLYIKYADIYNLERKSDFEIMKDVFFFKINILIYLVFFVSEELTPEFPGVQHIKVEYNSRL